MRKFLILALLPLATAGCISTATSIVKAPFQVAGKAVDWSTTSQEESDRNYGRKMRKQEAKEGRERKEREKQCRSNPDSSSCRQYQGYRAGY
ncbi:hypothetical protein FSB78_01240 [Sphingomonas ginsenosidivorax]|uniref:Lipoprotein n=1 Tax=Sphingomonas ginsenosidivorax TaxID=862135 RepID=A0A5C6UCI0_9SPHN|nr:hypothetical protein [Sphingomonas ginsenosidivorax]TXC69735.1 hypothetical protein FSB78_01240 [Sphingomonas ginsenosidivorax]